MKYDAIVVASGKGNRANLGFNKVLYVMKNGKTVLENACHLFFEDEDCKKVILVTNDEVPFNNEKLKIVPGGKERYLSVKNGLDKVDSEYVLIHDGARPFLNKEDLSKLKNSLIGWNGSILVTKATDTIKYVEEDTIKKTINRENIYYALTPQGFKTQVLKDGYRILNLEGITDDAQILEKLGVDVRIIEGSKSNIKLTNKEDFENI